MILGCLKTNNPHKASRTLFGSFLILIFISELNLLSILYPYLVSYFHKYNSNITLSSMSIIPIIWSIAMALLNPLVTVFCKKIGLKRTFYIIITIYCTIHWCLSYVTNFYTFAIIFALNGGITQACFMVIPFINCWGYFIEESRQTVVGIIYSCFAFSPIISTYITFFLINPDNKSQTIREVLENGKEVWFFDDEVTSNVPYFFKAFSIISLFFGYLGNYIQYDSFSENEKVKDTEIKEEIFYDEFGVEHKLKKLNYSDEEESDNSFNYNKTISIPYTKEVKIEIVKRKDIENIKDINNMNNNSKISIDNENKSINSIHLDKLSFINDENSNKSKQQEIIDNINTSNEKEKKITKEEIIKKLKSQDSYSSGINPENNNENNDINSHQKIMSIISLKHYLEVTKEKGFVSLVFYFYLTFIFTFTLHFIYKTIGLKNLKDDSFMTFVASFGAFINGGTRLISGVFFKRFGFKVLGTSIIILEVFISLFFENFSHSKILMMVSVFSFEVTYGYTSIIILLNDKLFNEKMVLLGPYMAISMTMSNFTAMIFVYLNEVFSWFPLYNVVLGCAILVIIPFRILLGHLKDAEDYNMKKVNEKINIPSS